MDGHILGGIHSDALREVQLPPIKLYDEPFGQEKEVIGDLFEVKAVLTPWRKVRVRLADGSVVEGWVNDEESATGAQAEEPPKPSPTPSDNEDLCLGPNEEFRPDLLEAERLTGIDAAALAALIDAEAAKLGNGQWDSNSRASTSSAAGLTQFLADTWLAHAKKKGTQLNQIGKKRGCVSDTNDIVSGREEELLALRFDPRLSIDSAAEYRSL